MDRGRGDQNRISRRASVKKSVCCTSCRTPDHARRAPAQPSALALVHALRRLHLLAEPSAELPGARTGEEAPSGSAIRKCTSVKAPLYKCTSLKTDLLRVHTIKNTTDMGAHHKNHFSLHTRQPFPRSAGAGCLLRHRRRLAVRRGVAREPALAPGEVLHGVDELLQRGLRQDHLPGPGPSQIGRGAGSQTSQLQDARGFREREQA